MIENQPRPNWSSLDRPGCRNIEARVLLNSDGIAIANLRFEIDASTDHHAAPYDIDVICMSGSGYTKVEDEVFELSQGQTIRWPAGKAHSLWTKSSELETLMIERHGT